MFAADRSECQFTGATGALEHQDLSPVDQPDLAFAGSVFKLNQAHVGLRKVVDGAAG
ncbi:hypothetical protein D3C80_2223360 [compost metagenome]